MNDSLKSWFKLVGTTLHSKINNLNLDIGGNLTVAGTVSFIQSINRTDAGAVDYNPSILTTDYLIVANNSASSRSIIISNEDIASGSPSSLRMFVIKDEYGNASVNNLTITLESGGTIDGAVSAIISSDYNSITLYLDGTNGFII